MAPPCSAREKAGLRLRSRSPKTSAPTAARATEPNRTSIGARSHPSSDAYFKKAATPAKRTTIPTLTGTLPCESQRLAASNQRDRDSGPAVGAAAASPAAASSAATPTPPGCPASSDISPGGFVSTAAFGGGATRAARTTSGGAAPSRAVSHASSSPSAARRSSSFLP